MYLAPGIPMPMPNNIMPYTATAATTTMRIRPQREQDELIASFSAEHRKAFLDAMALARLGRCQEGLRRFVVEGQKAGFANSKLLPIVIHVGTSVDAFREVLFYYSSK